MFDILDNALNKHISLMELLFLSKRQRKYLLRNDQFERVETFGLVSNLNGYASIRPVPDHEVVMPFLRLDRAIAIIGFTVNRGA